MLIITLDVRAPVQVCPRGVSVWVDDTDVARARERAVQALAAEGWELVTFKAATETTADDYYRPCPSQQAFQRAQTAGVAWRFDAE